MARRSPQSKAEAFHWWNSHLSQVGNLECRPEVVIPQVAQSVWAKICPLFLLFVIDDQDCRVYWESIQSVVAMFDTSRTTPNPLSHFPEFICRLHSLRHVLTPSTVVESLCFVDGFGFHDAAHFLLCQSPVFLFDPILYLRQRRHHIWKAFVGNLRLTGAFFQLYSTFAVPPPPNASRSRWWHRLLVTEVLFCLVRDTFNVHSDVLGLASHFLDLAIPLLEAAPPDVSGCILRSVFCVIAMLPRLMPREQLQARATRLIEICDRANCPHLLLVVRFLLSLKPTLVHQSVVIKLVSHREIRGLVDLEILNLVADQNSCIQIMSVLVKFAVKNKLWLRACFALIQELLVKFGDRKDIHEWAVVLLRRLFEFIGLSHGIRKYHRRALLICEVLNTLSQTPLPWLQQKIASIASGIGTKPVPLYFRWFFQVYPSICDELANRELELFLACRCPLKPFPFDPKGRVLVVPPVAIPVKPQSARGSIRFSKSQKTLAKEAAKKKSGQSILIKRPRKQGQNRPFTGRGEGRRSLA
jgi:hypothetical protein